MISFSQLKERKYQQQHQEGADDNAVERKVRST